MRAEAVMIHPKWTGRIADGYDVALLRLPRPVRNIVHPILPPPDNFYYHNNVLLRLGWGHEYERNGRTELLDLAKLQLTILRIVGQRHRPNSIQRLPKDHMVCSYAQGPRACKGEQNSLEKKFYSICFMLFLLLYCLLFLHVFFEVGFLWMWFIIVGGFNLIYHFYNWTFFRQNWLCSTLCRLYFQKLSVPSSKCIWKPACSQPRNQRSQSLG